MKELESMISYETIEKNPLLLMSLKDEYETIIEMEYDKY